MSSSTDLLKDFAILPPAFSMMALADLRSWPGIVPETMTLLPERMSDEDDDEAAAAGFAFAAALALGAGAAFALVLALAFALGLGFWGWSADVRIGLHRQMQARC
jgi:hypothetical protein